MVGDNVTAPRRFANDLRTFLRKFADQKERRARVVLLQQIEQLWRQRRIWAVVKGNRQFARRVRAANGLAEELCSRMDSAVRGRGNAGRKRRRNRSQKIHWHDCRTHELSAATSSDESLVRDVPSVLQSHRPLRRTASNEM